MSNKQTKSVGDTLKKSREKQEMNIHQIAYDLGIPHQYITCIEQNEFQVLPGSVYVAHYVERYARYLGLNASLLVKKIQTLTKETQHTVPKFRVTRTNFWVGPRILKYIGMGAVVLSCFGYIIFLGVQTVMPPILEISSPSDNVTSHERSMIVQGRTTIDAQLSINGQPISKQEDGTFQQEIQLTEGVNSLRISAIKKYSREQTIYRTIRYDDANDVSFLGLDVN